MKSPYGKGLCGAALASVCKLGCTKPLQLQQRQESKDRERNRGEMRADHYVTASGVFSKWRSSGGRVRQKNKNKKIKERR